VKLSALTRKSNESYPWRDLQPLIDGVLRCRADRVLWGLDWPHPNMFSAVPNDGDLVDALPEWIPDPALQRRVLVDNPHQLYFAVN
jgi:predicted TIM-barrel fold metal-dependent hydrolase